MGKGKGRENGCQRGITPAVTVEQQRTTPGCGEFYLRPGDLGDRWEMNGSSFANQGGTKMDQARGTSTMTTNRAIHREPPRLVINAAEMVVDVIGSVILTRPKQAWLIIKQSSESLPVASKCNC